MVGWDGLDLTNAKRKGAHTQNLMFLKRLIHLQSELAKLEAQHKVDWSTGWDGLGPR